MSNIFQLANINDGTLVGLSGVVTNWDLTQTKIATLCLDYQRISPSDGFSQTITNGLSALIIHVVGGPFTSGTVTMPSTPHDGQNLTISANDTITTFTLNPNSGQNITGAPSTLTASSPASFKWVSADSNWYRIG